jgi:hypothetical protein
MNDNQNRIQGENVIKAAEQTQRDAQNFKTWAALHIGQIELWVESNNFNMTDGGDGGDDGGDASISQISWLLLALLSMVLFQLV